MYYHIFTQPPPIVMTRAACRSDVQLYTHYSTGQVENRDHFWLFICTTEWFSKKTSLCRLAFRDFQSHPSTFECSKPFYADLKQTKADPLDESWWKCLKVGESGWKWMKVDESGWKWITWVKVDESGWKLKKADESEWKWIKWVNVDDIGWKRLKVDELGWKWMRVVESG